MNPMLYMLPMLLAGVEPLTTNAGRRRLREDGDPFPPCPDDAPFTMEVPAAAGKSSRMLSDVQHGYLVDEAGDRHPIGMVTRLNLGAREPRPMVPLQQLWEEHEQRRKDRLSAAQRAEEERVATAMAAAQAKRERKGAARLCARGGSVVALGDGAYRVSVEGLPGPRDGMTVGPARQLSQAGGDPSSPPKPPDDNR